MFYYFHSSPKNHYLVKIGSSLYVFNLKLRNLNAIKNDKIISMKVLIFVSLSGEFK